MAAAAAVTTTAMTTLSASIKEANRSLRPLTRLIRFFAKYPPSQYSAHVTGQAIPTSKQRIAMGGTKALSSTSLPQASSIPEYTSASAPTSIPTTLVEEDITVPSPPTPVQFTNMIPPTSQSSSPSSSLPDSPSITMTRTTRTSSTTTAEPSSTSRRSFPPNPFLPYKNPETGRWRGARVGLRQQADLFRYAQEYGVEDLLPPSIKSSTYKHQRILERGLAVRGTGEGQQVKGHRWERQMASTLEKRRKAMEQMPELIREWEQKGHGRGWKKYPR